MLVVAALWCAAAGCVKAPGPMPGDRPEDRVPPPPPPKQAGPAGVGERLEAGISS
jgi:hypothetical protein